MCELKPGPRCVSHARPKFEAAAQNLQKVLQDNSSTEKRIDALEKFYKAQADYYSTVQGQNELAGIPGKFKSSDKVNGLESLKGLKEKREKGVFLIKYYMENIPTEEQNTALKERISSMKSSVIQKELIQSRIDDLTKEVQIASKIDKELRENYTQLLDNGDLNPELAKTIARKNLQTKRFRQELNAYKAMLR